MSVHSWYRSVHLLTLALSGLCLVVAEGPFLPGAQPYLLLLVALMALALFTEGRWVLPAWTANVLAVALAVAGGRWFWKLFTSPDSILQHAAFPVVLVPYAGVLFLVLLVTLLFRSRGEADFWRLQGLAFVQVAVTCTLAAAPAFGLCLALYLVSALTCLALRYRVVEGRTGWDGGRLPGESADIEHRARLDTARVPMVGRWMSRFSLRWALAIGGPVIVLSLMTPRTNGLLWDPYGQFGGKSPTPPPAPIGFEEEMDIGQTGGAVATADVAFTVEVVNSFGTPKTDLPTEQRWRGVVLDFYDGGKWKNLRRGRLREIGSGDQQLPDFGPDQYFLTFRVHPQRAGGLFVADPVRFGTGPVRIPILALNNGPRRDRLFAEYAGSLVPLPLNIKHEVQYTQVSAPSRTPDRVAAGYIHPRYQRVLKEHRLPELEAWTRSLLTRLAKERRHGLTPADLAVLDAGPVAVPPRAEQVARGLCDYLALSGDYTYTFDVRHEDMEVDPAIDFLCNTREGPCGCYATGLALMLRSLGIPARVVKGFRGQDAQENGRYLVWQHNAHSWVETLVAATGDAPGVTFEWLTLDPTPSSETLVKPTSSPLLWLWDRIRNLDRLWTDLIVDFGPDQQADLLRALAPFLAGLGLLGLVRVGYLRWRAPSRSNDASAVGVASYRRLVAMLGRHGGPCPGPAQTPREFAAAAAAFLNGTPAAALGGLPADAAGLLYRARFGAQPPSADEERALDDQLNRLATLLKGRKP
jgi:transglutaminase-like putative cysteine protease